MSWFPERSVGAYSGLEANTSPTFLPHLCLQVLAMATRARLRLTDSTPPDPPAIVAAPQLPVDAPTTDEDIADLPQEKRVQLALAAIEGKLLSERKAAIYFSVHRSMLQRRLQGVKSHKEAHIHERKLTPAQEDVLTEWTKVRMFL
jgi:hypothetical protein